MADDDWIMGATAAQDAYQPVDNPWLPDVGAPAIGSGGQFSPGVPQVNRAADVLSRYPGRVMGSLLGLPQQAFGASEEMRQGGTYDPAPAVQTALMTMGGGVAGTGPGGVAVGAGPIRAYHSSPHDFERFDLSKIGTGEGAQVYGHGLYFAENPAVSGQGGQYWKQFKDRFGGDEAQAMNKLWASNFDRAHAIETSQRKLNELAEARKSGVLPAGVAGGYTDPVLIDSITRSMQRSQQAQHDLLASGQPVGPRTYEVNINAEPSHFLDWDKKFNEQPQAIQDIIRGSGIHPEAPGPMGTKVPVDLPTGLLAGNRLQNPSSMLLKNMDKADIPGIRYLDAGSRPPEDIPLMEKTLATVKAKLAAAPRSPDAAFYKKQIAKWEDSLAKARNPPPPTYNYVVRNPALIDIMRKYGLVGAAPVGLGALAAQDQYQSQ